MRFTFILSLCLIFSFLFAPTQDVKAMDPVSIAILAPFAISAAQTMAPYIIKGLGNVGRQFIVVGTHFIQFFRLPWGLLEATVLCPFLFSDGIYNITRGAVAPVLMIGSILYIPITAFDVF